MSSSLDPPLLDLDAYAAMTAALAEGARPREELLGERGLDEASWNEIDQAYQAALSRAMDEEHEGIPPLIAAYAEAFDRARAAQRTSGPRLSLDRFADATREIQRRGDPVAALAHLGITISDYLDANQHWTRRILKEPDLAERYRSRLLR